MKNVLMSFLFGFLILAVACTPPADKTEDASEETTEEMADAEATSDESATAKVVASTESYTTTVVEDGIASPRKELKGSIGNAEITINYGSPSVKGRTIWGDLVAFDKVWRTGANAATTIEFSSDVTVEGEALAAGKYGLFTQPSDGSVVVIFNKVTDMWGAGKYDEGEDALRVTVTPQAQDDSQEAMEFMVDGDNIVLAWDNWKIPFGVATAAVE